MMKPTTATRTELAHRYDVSYTTFLKMLKEIKFKMPRNRRILTVKELNFIFEELGAPPEIEKK